MKAVDALINGFWLLWQPKIRFYVLTPLLVNICIFASLIIYFAYSAQQMTHAVTHTWLNFLPDILLTIIDWIAMLGSLILSWFLLSFVFILVANIVAAPFSSALAEAIAIHRGIIAKDQATPLSVVLKGIPVAILRECRKLGFFLPRLIVLFVCAFALSFVPVLNLLVPLLWIIWGAWVLSFDFLDFGSELIEQDHHYTLNLMQQNRSNSLLFGNAVYAGGLIPIVNLLVIPWAVSSGLLLWEQFNSKKPD